MDIQEGGLLDAHEVMFKHIKVRNHLHGKVDGMPVRVLELDFEHQKIKNGLINWHWKPSTLITFHYPLNLENSKITAFQNSYLTNPTGADEGRMNLDNIIPIKGHKIKVMDDLFNKKYTLYGYPTDRNTTVDISSILPILLTIEKIYFKDKYKFISFYKDQVAILIFDQRLFQLKVAESLLKTNPFIRFFKELENMYSILNIFVAKNK